MTHLMAMAGALKAPLPSFGQGCHPVCEHVRTWSCCQLDGISLARGRSGLPLERGLSGRRAACTTGGAGRPARSTHSLGTSGAGPWLCGPACPPCPLCVACRQRPRASADLLCQHACGVLGAEAALLQGAFSALRHAQHMSNCASFCLLAQAACSEAHALMQRASAQR